MSVSTQGDATEAKTIQPHKFYPLDLCYLMSPVEDVKLQFSRHFPLWRLDD